MSAKCFFKYFAIALGVQVGLLVLSMWFYYVGVFLYIYWPWVWLVDQLAGPPGPESHAMAGAVILGGLLGFLAYSLMAGVIICLYKARRRVP
jgi:hypothetical protein